MPQSVYEGDILQRATSSSDLRLRLDKNRQYSSRDFGAWLFERLRPEPGMRVLDVGCGTGAQSLRLAEAVGAEGSVAALDLSPESIARLQAEDRLGNIDAVAADMDDLEAVLATRFANARYDLVHSCYALYYARDPLRVLDTMRGAMAPGGRLAVCAPDRPHGMVAFVRRFSAIPPQAEESLNFAQDLLEPWLRRHFADVTIHLLKNVVRLPDLDEFLRFYRATTYYDAAAEPAIAAAVEAVLTETGGFVFAKHSYLAVASSPVASGSEA